MSTNPAALPLGCSCPELARDAMTLVDRSMLQVLQLHAIPTDDPAVWLPADERGRPAQSWFNASDALADAFHWLEERKLARLRSEAIHLHAEAVRLVQADDHARGDDLRGLVMLVFSALMLGVALGAWLAGMP
ncbi:MAG TPA: hypothetical protein VFS13_00715 [Steroidobacteraceae bacterium]|nr:hypothetical protein [Steroidobacteraceae bacterium]